MPARQRGEPYRLGKGWGLRFYDEAGRRRRKSGFTSRTEALDWFEKVERPRQLGFAVAPTDETFSAFVDRYLIAHAVGREPSTLRALKERLRYATKTFGDVTLRDLERRASEIAKWTSTLPAGSRYGIVQAFRQAVATAIRWGLMGLNPVKAAGANPQPPPPEVRPLTIGDVDKIATELGPRFGPMIVFAAETGMRPEEWLALERRDVDKENRIVRVERTVVEGRVKSYGKTARARRSVPLSARALAALESIPPRLDSPLLFPGTRGGYLNLRNFRRRDWIPAVEAAGIERARLYDLRHSFASSALAAGVPSGVLAHYFGASERMIDRAYSHLVSGSHDLVRDRLDAWAAQESERLGQERAAESERP